MLRESDPSATCAGGLEVVDQHRNVQRRMDVDQQVHMVALAAELDEMASPRRKAVDERAAQVAEQFWCERLASVLGHKNDV